MKFKKGSVGNLIHGTVFCCAGKKNYGLANSLKSKIFCYPKRNETEPKELMRLDETRKFIVFFVFDCGLATFAQHDKILMVFGKEKYYPTSDLLPCITFIAFAYYFLLLCVYFLPTLS